MEGLLIVGAFVALAVLAHWFGDDSRNGVKGDEPSWRQGWLAEAAWRRRRISEVLDPFSFHLEILVRQKLDRYVQQAARERLIRSVEARPMRRICNTRVVYILSSAIVWAAIIGALGVLLRGSPHFAQVLAILGSGAVWFVILVPTAVLRGQQSS